MSPTDFQTTHIENVLAIAGVKACENCGNPIVGCRTFSGRPITFDVATVRSSPGEFVIPTRDGRHLDFVEVTPGPRRHRCES